MERCLAIAKEAGLENAHWSGHTGLPGTGPPTFALNFGDDYTSSAARLAATFADRAGCVTHPRDCGGCEASCGMRGFMPSRVT